MNNNLLKLDFNERPEGIPDWLKSESLDMQELWKYPDRSSYEKLLAESMNSTASRFFITNGGDEGIELLFKLCKLSNQSLLLPLPAFSQYLHNIKVWDIDNLCLPACEDLSIDKEAIINNLQPNQWLVLTRPNNPTGEVLTESDLRVILNAALIKGTKVFLDEAYIEFSSNINSTDFSQEYRNVIRLRSFSKAYGLAGARLGYLSGEPELVDEFKKIAMPFNVSRLNLQMLARALGQTQEVKDYTQAIAINRNALSSQLRTYGLEVFESGANFVLFQCSESLKQLVSSVLQRNKISIKTQVVGIDRALRITIPLDLSTLSRCFQDIFEPDVLGFDMDGVLIDTSESYDTSIQKTVEYYSNQTPSLDDIQSLRSQGGFNNDWDLTAELLKQLGCEQKYETIKTTFQNYYLGANGKSGFNQQESKLLKTSLLQKCNQRSAVITGRPREEALAGLSLLELDVDELVSLDDVENPKPDPMGIRKVQDKLSSRSMWFFGDTVDDMQAGRQSGCICIGVGDQKNILLKNGADTVVSNVNQGLELLLGESE